jgi:uncharacterized protein YbbK (DUF523 family)
MKNVLISACLLGDAVRYDGGSKAVQHPVLTRWLSEGRVVRVCPELAGGLAVPRPPAERRGLRVVTNTGADVTAEFGLGAEQALHLAQRVGARVAVLKENSPSCGSHQINDGSFRKTRIHGEGVTTALLRAHGIQVFSEAEWEAADQALRAATQADEGSAVAETAQLGAGRLPPDPVD